MAVENDRICSTFPACPVFGQCGGCLYQDIPYADELAKKDAFIRTTVCDPLAIPRSIVKPVVPSPKVYHYRNRLDLKLLRTKDQNIHIGFSPAGRYRVVPIDTCYIADEHIAAHIPTLKNEVIERLPAKYRVANITVRTGQDGRVFWGGVGRRSLAMQPSDYFWVELRGKKIFYSLDTFFQANMSILPALFDVIGALPLWGADTVFYDLYGGVGLFAIGLSDRVGHSILIEEGVSSIAVARYNRSYHALVNLAIHHGRVETILPTLIATQPVSAQAVAMIDPPRGGLSAEAAQFLSQLTTLRSLLYLSCNPEALVRDLKVFSANGWQIEMVQPFDFFPRTKHIETLVLLRHRTIVR